jgi:hypothetical protein
VDGELLESHRERSKYLIQYLKGEVDISQLQSNSSNFEEPQFSQDDSFAAFDPNAQLAPLELSEAKISPTKAVSPHDVRAEMKRVKKILNEYLRKFEEFEDKERFQKMRKGAGKGYGSESSDKSGSLKSGVRGKEGSESSEQSGPEEKRKKKSCKE